MRRLEVRSSLILFAIIFAGCLGSSSQNTGDVNIRPLEDILVSGPEFTEATPRSVTVFIDTQIPVVCAVVYGTSISYGELATDTDMTGGGHVNHHPLLSGLQPDTEYHIRLQGVGADGTLYRSRDYTFSTPSADESTMTSPEGVNLALQSSGTRISDVSSNFGGSGIDGVWGANNAIDGDIGTEWSSDGDGDDAFIELDFPQKTRVTAVGLMTRTMGNSAQINSFAIVSEVGQRLGPLHLPDAGGVHYFQTDFTAKRLRFEVAKSSGGNTGAVEIEVYGEPIS
jgi:hypothetical protein